MAGCLPCGLLRLFFTREEVDQAGWCWTPTAAEFPSNDLAEMSCHISLAAVRWTPAALAVFARLHCLFVSDIATGQ